MTQTVLILGSSGKIGAHCAETFWNAGWTVRHFNRKTDDMVAAAMGANVIVNGLNPPMYHDWKRQIPAITAQVIAAAKASDATVILPGNVYNFGVVNGEINEDTPQTPNSRKGHIRVEMEASDRAAGVQTIVLRAGNFIDPNSEDDIMGVMLMRAVKKGRITHAGSPSARQAYAYVPDWARAAVMLAEKRAELDAFNDIPFPGHTFTVHALKTKVAATTGRSYRLAAFPWWMMTALSPVMEVARELREMRYLYDMDHWLGDAVFKRILPEFHPTDLDRVMLCSLPDDVYPNKTVRSGQQSVAAE